MAASACKRKIIVRSNRLSDLKDCARATGGGACGAKGLGMVEGGGGGNILDDEDGFRVGVTDDDDDDDVDDGTEDEDDDDEAGCASLANPDDPCTSSTGTLDAT